jgi:DNA-binding transcriptional regulator PaaX
MRRIHYADPSTPSNGKDVAAQLEFLSHVEQKCSRLLSKFSAVIQLEIGTQQSGSRAMFHEILFTEHQYVSDLHFVVKFYIFDISSMFSIQRKRSNGTDR